MELLPARRPFILVQGLSEIRQGTQEISRFDRAGAVSDVGADLELAGFIDQALFAIKMIGNSRQYHQDHSREPGHSFDVGPASLQHL